MKKILLAFIVICTLICAVPTAAMIVNPTTESTDNRSMASFPALKTEEGKANRLFFEQFEDYYNDHFAFRNELIYADAMIQSKVFGVSNVDNVVVGKDGWLFYTSTLKDYLGTENLSETEIYSIAHNIEIVKEYLESKGKKFLLTIPANKNTLYGENMPYYDSHIVNSTHNVDALKPLLEKLEIPYADLVELFRNESEVLYLKRDSHWNMKGALMAYNKIMDSLELEHEDYSKVNVVKAIDEIGDLNKMLYTFYGEKEANFRYDIPQEYEYIGEFGSVEDTRIETSNPEGQGDLLMYRDSFGNTLIPIIANHFAHSVFSKESVYNLEMALETGNPDIVVFEKVERNLAQFMTMPPIISSPEASVQVYGTATTDEQAAEADTADEQAAELLMKTNEFNFMYYEVSSELDASELAEAAKGTSELLIGVNGTYYKPYYISENKCTIYLKKDNVTFPAKISIIRSGDKMSVISERSYDVGDIEE